MGIRRVEPGDGVEWLRLRTALWPEVDAGGHAKEMGEYLAGPDLAVFVAAREGGGLAGFLEASLRPQADGCSTAPVGYIEGWYVDPDVRRSGVGGRLVAAAEAWARGRGCREMASDCLLDNDVSFRAHTALGYAEVNRVIQFRKPLGGGGPAGGPG
jgi:aminoglycoside 6'-N-acetyltransferase I